MSQTRDHEWEARRERRNANVAMAHEAAVVVIAALIGLAAFWLA